MRKNLFKLNRLLLVTVALVVMSRGVFAADCPSDIKAITNEDARVALLNAILARCNYCWLNLRVGR